MTARRPRTPHQQVWSSSPTSVSSPEVVRLVPATAAPAVGGRRPAACVDAGRCSGAAAKLSTLPPRSWLLVRAATHATPTPTPTPPGCGRFSPRFLPGSRAAAAHDNSLNCLQSDQQMPASGRSSRRRRRSSIPRPKHRPDPSTGLLHTGSAAIGLHEPSERLPTASVSTRRCHTPMSTLLPQPGDGPPLQMATKRCSPTAPKRTTATTG